MSNSSFSSVDCNLLLKKERHAASSPVWVSASHAKPAGSVDALLEVHHPNRLVVAASQKEPFVGNHLFQYLEYVISGTNSSSAQTSR
jgi:hypothetical protein